MADETNVVIGYEEEVAIVAEAAVQISYDKSPTINDVVEAARLAGAATAPTDSSKDNNDPADPKQ